MNEYIIKKINNDGYDRFLLCLTFESIIEYLSSIESSPLMAHSSGKVLIDQLLITGNGQNRFLSCDFKNGKLDVTTASNVVPDDSFRTLAVRLLHENYAYVEHSILTDSQRQCIKNCIAF